MQVGRVLSADFAHADFVLAYMGKMGVSHVSMLISPGQLWIDERIVIQLEQEWWPHILSPFCRFV